MKKLGKNIRIKLNGKALMVSLAVTMLSSCIVITDDDYGPSGNDGKAYFGIDYDWTPPYSYWDNNPQVPNNPFFGEYYRTWSGTYEFEYFINEWEYWYGTYHIYVNAGQHGQPYGQQGYDGLDSFLLLICNQDGFYMDSWDECDCSRSEMDDGAQVIEGKNGDHSFKIEMKKADVRERPTNNIPKYKLSPDA